MIVKKRCGVLFLQNNAMRTNRILLFKRICDLGTELHEYLPYSPDLAPTC